jgi:hypothetical protein
MITKDGYEVLDERERAACWDLLSAAQLCAREGDARKALWLMGSVSSDPRGHVAEIREMHAAADGQLRRWLGQALRALGEEAAA